MRKRSVAIRPRRDVPPRMLPCCLCSMLIPHGAAEGEDAHLIYRAQVADGLVWIPSKHHAANDRCRDPGPETVSFWRDEIRRENYKAERRMMAAQETA